MAEKKRTEDVGQAEVQAKFDEANEKGYFGEVPEQRPFEDYTLKSVTSKQD
jgi:hypothetical protein